MLDAEVLKVDAKVLFTSLLPASSRAIDDLLFSVIPCQVLITRILEFLNATLIMRLPRLLKLFFLLPLLGACTTSVGDGSPTISEILVKQDETATSPAANSVVLVMPRYFTLTFTYSCNAPAGGFSGSKCRGTAIVPTPPENLPKGMIHCKTITTVHKRDTATSAGWTAEKGADDILFFRHSISAESGVFAGGKEVRVTYKHFVVYEVDRVKAGELLGCTFSTAESVTEIV
jgi:hypothetical protein